MKKGWIIFFVLFGLFAFMGVIFMFAVTARFDDTPVVEKNTVLQLNLTGKITEHYPRSAFGREFEGASLQMHDIRKALEMAKVDERIRGVHLKIGFTAIGWAKAQEIRDGLEDFKESGKFVTAFMETCNEKTYYIALAADEINLQPHAYVELNGLAAEIPFYKRMYNKLGVDPQVDNIGKYKSAGDILKRDSMSPAHREATQALLDDIYDGFVDAIVDKRSVDRSTLERALDRGLYRAEAVFDLKLVDGLKYNQEVVSSLKKRVHGDEGADSNDRTLRSISVGRYAELSPSEVGLDKGSHIALIYGTGVILPGDSGYHPWFGRLLGSNALTTMLRAAERNKSVEAIVLRLDSPGGSSQASDEIWAAIKKVREKKPVVVSMGDVAASGGYWISLACDAIVAQPLTITGSIGVVTTLYNLSGTYDKLGIVWETVKRGAHADVPTDKRPLTREEWRIYERLNREIYQVFVQKTADARDRSWEEIDKVAQGRVWTGERALQYGLVDSLGGLDLALAFAKQKAGIAADDPTQWIVYPQPKGFLASLFEKINVRMAKLWSRESSEVALMKNLPTEFGAAIRQLALAGRMRKGEVLALEPFVPEIN